MTNSDAQVTWDLCSHGGFMLQLLAVITIIQVIQAERGYYYSLTPWEHLALLNLKSGIKLYQLHF